MEWLPGPKSQRCCRGQVLGTQTGSFRANPVRRPSDVTGVPGSGTGSGTGTGAGSVVASMVPSSAGGASSAVARINEPIIVVDTPGSCPRLQ